MNISTTARMPPTNATDTRTLNDLITSTLALLNQFVTSLTPSTNTSTSDIAKPIDNPPNPLLVLSDAAKLVKAHTTKLSLLAINKPFTASAITKVLKELTATCLPAMMSAVQICEQERAMWGSTMGKEVKARVRRVFKEMEMLLSEVQSIAAGAQRGAGRDSLSSTGVVWESCDALVELEQDGIVGLALQKAEQYRETIKDAIQELQEWKEGEDLDSEGFGDGLADSDDEAVDGDKDSIEDLFNAANSMPKDRPELKELVEQAQVKLRSIVNINKAVAKRRILTFKIDTNDADTEQEPAVYRLDDLMQHLKRMPHQVDELASNFYDLYEKGAREAIAKIVAEARAACEGMQLDWNGGEDEFTVWFRKWSSAIN
ncbi:hypothetical protein LTR37_019744 [Vermiconidia calcicola]|uniref:Uncharacterized protein n=1 Tax=Vermiconidia calcicola TaxID=1690605 RepID=A0ACC3MD76_9PEZI|nr:hypothetical protein LTR37_019744 [Vermiconidia calcicola]